MVSLSFDPRKPAKCAGPNRNTSVQVNVGYKGRSLRLEDTHNMPVSR